MNNSGAPKSVPSSSQQVNQNQAPAIEDLKQTVEKTKKRRPGYGK